MKNKKPDTISIVTLGCSKNIVDSEVLMNQMQANSLALVDDPSDAEILIINTCGFIDTAKQESINTILEASEMKKQGRLKKVFVAGCLSGRYHDELRNAIPEVDRFFGVTDFENIVKELGGNYKHELLGERRLTTPSHFAYLKISEGCDNPCSFCAIPIMRGKHISKPIEEIIHDAKFLAKCGVKELILIGQDTTYYGLDRYAKRTLAHVLTELTEIDGIEWIRLMYTFPSHFPLDVLDVIQDNPKLCKYLDMPIQHISDSVLKSMRRGITRKTTTDLINTIRDTIPEITLRTTLIVGYPTETENDFTELYRFIEETQFDRLGVFTYSVEDHTYAEPLGDPIPQDIKDERRNRIMELQSGISLKKNLSKVGSIVPVMIDRVEGEYFIGRSDRDAPEVDNEVLIEKNNTGSSIGTIVPVMVTDAEEFDLIGNVQETLYA